MKNISCAFSIIAPLLLTAILKEQSAETIFDTGESKLTIFAGC